MKSFIRTITILIVLNLAVADFALAQDAPEERIQEIEETLAERQAELAEKTAEIAEKVAQTTRQKEAEIGGKAAEVAKKVAEVAEKVAQTTRQKEAELRELVANLRVLNQRTSQYSAATALVIPTAEEIKPEDLITIMEDLNVMARIFDKKLAQSYLISGEYLMREAFRRRIRTRFSSDTRGTKAMYIQGYGALFLTNVDFPLSPPPKAEEVKETEEEAIDPVWEQMKQEMYEPEDVSRRRRTDDRPEEKYDPEKVENLKSTLIKALKHAANIRGLKSDEWVNVATVSSSTILTVRAKKSDIDTFSKGELDFDEFRQKVVIFTYPYLPAVERGRSISTNLY